MDAAIWLVYAKRELLFLHYYGRGFFQGMADVFRLFCEKSLRSVPGDDFLVPAPNTVHLRLLQEQHVGLQKLYFDLNVSKTVCFIYHD